MAIGDPYGGGLLGNAFGNPLFNFGLGLLSQSGPSMTPQSPWQAIGKAGAYASEAQQKASENALYREKLLASQQEREGQKALFDALDSGKITLPAGVDPTLAKSLFRAAPGEAAKAYLGSVFQDPQTAAAIAASNAATMKTVSELAAAQGETLGSATTAFADIDAIAQASRRLEGADTFSSTLLKPGGFIEKAGLLTLAPATIQAAKLAGIDTGDAELNAADALTIQKATSSLTTSLQAQVPSLRSNANLQNIQTAMAANTPWSAKRRQLVTSLSGLFADLQQQGLDKQLSGFDSMVKLRDQLHQDDLDFIKRGEATRGKGAPTASAAPPSAAPDTTAAPPMTGQGFQNGQIVPQPAPQYSPLSPARPDVQIVPPANAAEGAPRVPQLRYAPNGEPVFHGFAEVKRAEKNGWLAQARATGIWVGNKHYSWQPE